MIHDYGTETRDQEAKDDSDSPSGCHEDGKLGLDSVVCSIWNVKYEYGHNGSYSYCKTNPYDVRRMLVIQMNKQKIAKHKIQKIRNYIVDQKYIKAGAELCQAHIKLGQPASSFSLPFILFL